MIKKSFLLSLSLICLGISALIGQVALIRELTSTFQGNELSLGIALGSWLLGNALGSYLSKRLIPKIKDKLSSIIVLQILISLFLYSQLFFARTIKTFAHIPFYELATPFSIFSFSLLILSPLSFICGFAFVLLCKVYPVKSAAGGAAKPLFNRVNASQKETSQKIGQAYILEAVGTTIGGILFSYLLIKYLHSFQIAALLGILNLGLAFLLSLNHSKKALIFLSSFLLLGNVFLFFKGSDYLQRTSAEKQWQGRELLEYRDSIYGNIAVLKKGREFSIYGSGKLFFTTADKEFEEELVHLSLLQHPLPERVLLIGGGISHIEELFKYPLKRVDYVELDPLLIKINQRLLSQHQKQILQNPELNINFTDGRFFVKNCRQKYDVIILNLPDPSTLQLNRFYTQGFFKEISKILDKKGIFSLHISSSAVYLNPQSARYNSSIYQTVRSVFPYTVIIPGEVLYIIASPANIPTSDIKILTQRWRKRNLNTKYFTSHHLYDKFDPEKIGYVLKSLAKAKTQINLDFHPISFYYNLIVYNSFFHPHRVGFWEAISHLDIKIILILISIFYLLIRWKKINIFSVSKLCIFTTGFAGLCLETVILLSFQILYGYIYAKLGVIIAAFMVGIAAGAWLSTKSLTRATPPKTLAKLESSIAVYALILPLLLFVASKGILLRGGIFFLLAAIIGGLVGAEFPVVNHLFLSQKKELNSQIEKSVGAIYAADLLGGFSGAILTSVFLIPILGIFSTCLVVAMLNLMTFLLIRSKPR
ncbi:MAG: hypothetical protein J7J51_02200 [Candidatus Omnitrophica bacterium]|nr:hypothetical protein [Candidatus Omnitrophota bacterium]